ncbi:MAG: ATP-binding protein, partial [Longimicrobiales bacterium]|nr:ATP-binding protein [Longimicrobiales bacterium]
VPYEASGMGRWGRELSRGVTLGGTVDDFPPEEQELLRAQEILSLVVTPILLGDRLWGFIGFDDCDVRRSWSRAELDILQAAANTVAAALLRRETLGALEDSRHQLRHVQRMEAVGRLAGGIAHDFNNLLTGILSNAEFLLDDLEESVSARAEAEAIRKAALRASRLTRQLLAFSKRQSMRPATVRLPELVRETEEFARRLIGEGIRVEARMDDDVPSIWADRVQVEQVLMNLVVNAGDAMPDGGELVLEVRRGEAHELTGRGLTKDPGHVLVSVSDTGLGMDPAIREKVFEPFFTTKDSGTGMGLSIVYGIMNQIGGAVWIDSEPGEGTEVTVAFPVDPDPSADETSTAEGASESDLPSGEETILVVEDDDAVRVVTERILSHAGYTVIARESADAALAVLRSGDTAVDLVLTDIGLPDRSGTDMAREIRDLHDRLPIVFMSGFPAQRGIDEPAAPGDRPLDFLAKPFTRSALLRRIRRHLDGEAPSNA